jgi:FAD:protein FMN transferase
MRAESSSAAIGSASWQALGTSVVLRVSAPAGLGPARSAVAEELEAIDLACSRFREDSELSRVNANAGRWTRVGPLLIEALEVALRGAELSDGDVDPTVGRALELAGYDRDWRLLEPAGALPQAPPAVTARVKEGWRELAIDRVSSRVRVPTGVRLDLGATAKAWVADRAAAAAARAAGCGALVGLGGDIATGGDAPPGGWRIRVTDDHRSDHSAQGQTIAIASGGVATSSTAVRRWRRAGYAMHHIIDPRTGSPVDATWRTVSVAAASCTDANIAATAALVRSAAAPRWLGEMGLPARLVDREGEITAVGGWPAEAAARARPR